MTELSMRLLLDRVTDLTLTEREALLCRLGEPDGTMRPCRKVGKRFKLGQKKTRKLLRAALAKVNAHLEKGEL